MQKKTCKACGKTWIIERFDDHFCPVIPKKPRGGRTKAAPAEPPAETAGDGASPLVALSRGV